MLQCPHTKALTGNMGNLAAAHLGQQETLVEAIGRHPAARQRRG